MTPYEAQQAQLQIQLAATNAAIQQHNLAVQAFASQASANRPRARTAGVLESPGSRLLRNYYPTASRLDSSLNVDLCESPEYEGLTEAAAAMNLGRSNSRNDSMLTPDDNLEGPTRALWLGSIPSSTTVSTLTEMFKSYGSIISARVLTHKNCGFVNFERLESAMSARRSFLVPVPSESISPNLRRHQVPQMQTMGHSPHQVPIHSPRRMVQMGSPPMATLPVLSHDQVPQQ
jgi:protein JSN1